MIVLPEGEEILDVVCGDKDFWVVNATQNMAHVKPAKEGSSTNLNLVTGSGAVYSFLLTEKTGGTPDLKVYVNADPNAPKSKRMRGIVIPSCLLGTSLGLPSGVGVQRIMARASGDSGHACKICNRRSASWP